MVVSALEDVWKREKERGNIQRIGGKVHLKQHRSGAKERQKENDWDELCIIELQLRSIRTRSPPPPPFLTRHSIEFV